jgi:biotin carboxyl carrier protein
VAAVTTRWLVRATPATALPDDTERIVDTANLPVPSRRVAIGETRRRPDGRLLVEAVVDGWRFELELEDAERAELRARATRDGPNQDRSAAGTAGGPAEIRAMIPGRVAEVRVNEGDAVVAGQTLLVVEAMKMQNELRAPRDGTVRAVAVADGQTIELGDLLVSLE